MTKKGERPGHELEKLVERLMQHTVKDGNVTRRAIVKDREGILREIDILVEYTDPSGFLVRHYIECKDTNRRVGVEQMESFIAKTGSFNANLKSYVSTSGFSKSARAKAKFSDVQLLAVHDAMSEKWRIDPPFRVLVHVLTPVLSVEMSFRYQEQVDEMLRVTGCVDIDDETVTKYFKIAHESHAYDLWEKIVDDWSSSWRSGALGEDGLGYNNVIQSDSETVKVSSVHVKRSSMIGPIGSIPGSVGFEREMHDNPGMRTLVMSFPSTTNVDAFLKSGFRIITSEEEVSDAVIQLIARMSPTVNRSIPLTTSLPSWTRTSSERS